MSAHWSTAAQNGSAYGGFENPAQEPPSTGSIQPAFEVDNVSLDVAMPPEATSRRRKAKKARIAADVKKNTSCLYPHGHGHQSQQQLEQTPDQQHQAAKLATQSKTLAGSGAQFDNART